MTVEEIIKEIPTVINREVTEKCACCGKENTVKISYDLRLEVRRDYGLKGSTDRYLAYYMACGAETGYELRYIGEHSGPGELSLVKALLKLKEYIRND